MIKDFKLTNNSRVLDIGCGKGYLLYELKLLLPKIKIVGIDISSYAIKKAKELGCVVILNPAPAREIKNSDYKNIDFFTPNEKEASFYLKKNIESDADIKWRHRNF